jgi:hypothetical protein
LIFTSFSIFEYNFNLSILTVFETNSFETTTVTNLIFHIQKIIYWKLYSHEMWKRNAKNIDRGHWYIPTYTPQCEMSSLGNSTKSPTSNPARTVWLCWLVVCPILSYTSCRNKQESCFNIQRNMSIPITLLTNHFFFKLYKCSFNTEITFLKI